MSFYAWSALINFITSLILAFIILKKNKKVLTDKIFILSCSSVAFWSLFYFFWQLTNKENLALLFSRLLIIGAVFIAIFYLHFIIVFLNKKKQNKFVIISLYIFGIISFLFDFTPLFVNRVVPESFVAFWPKPGMYFHFFLITWLIIFIYAFIILINAYKKNGGIKKEQIKLNLMAIIIGVLGGITNYFLWYGIEIRPVGNILISVFFILVAYAIIAKHFMDMKLILRKSTVYVLSLVLTLIPPVILKYLGMSYLPEYYSWFDVILLIISISLFPAVRNRVFRFANKYLFTSLYDSKKVISELSDKLSTSLVANNLFSFVYEILHNAFHMKAMAVLMFDKKGENLLISYNKGFECDGKKIPVGPFKKVYEEFLKRDKIIIFEELKNSNRRTIQKFVKEYNQKLGVDVLVPLNVKGKSIGLIAFGSKESGDIYNQEDTDVLKVISAQVAIALENATLYEEAKKFNIKLRKEVDKATKDLREANVELRKLDEAKSEFISIASHQLRTPLTVIKGYVSMMLEGSFGKLEEAVDENLYKVYESNERLIHLVENLLNISRIESGRLQFNFEKVNLADTVESVIEELEHNAQKKKLYLDYKGPKEPIILKIDEEKIRQVVINLIDNSIKYTKHGGVTVLLKKKGEKALFCVSDTGMGISKEDLPHLFKKFSRGKDTSLIHTEGTGLGLYVGRMMIRAHQGKIWAESEGVGKGSKFCFELPLKAKNLPKKLEGRVI